VKLSVTPEKEVTLKITDIDLATQAAIEVTAIEVTADGAADAAGAATTKSELKAAPETSQSEDVEVKNETTEKEDKSSADPNATEPTMPSADHVAAAADLDARIAQQNVDADAQLEKRLSEKAVPPVSLRELKQALGDDCNVRASDATWKLLEGHLLALAASGASGTASPEDELAAEKRAALVRHAAEISAECAAQAEVRANAKLSAKLSAKAVKAAIADAAVKAGLQGRLAKKSAESKQSSVASSTASSDTEDWHVVPSKM